MPVSVLTPNPHSDPDLARRRYTWPWLVLAGFVFAILLAVLWMSREIQRTKRIRDLSAPNSQLGTNTGSNRSR
jgi:hypothetical protein